jgi:hypothetical protein
MMRAKVGAGDTAKKFSPTRISGLWKVRQEPAQQLV